MKTFLSVLFVLSFFSFGLASPAMAATITVTSNSMDELTTNSSCSIREAIINANNDAATYADCTAGSGNDEISISAGTYCLSIQNADANSTTPTSGTDEEYSATGDLDITEDLTITGAGASTTIIDAGGGSSTTCSSALMDRVMEMKGSGIAISISGIKITGGYLSSASSSGGGIFSQTNGSSGNITLTIADSDITGNTVTNSSGSTSGGIYSYDTVLVITDSSVSGNTVTGSSYGKGGGIFLSCQYCNNSSTLTNVTISGNTVTSTSGDAMGGGIYVSNHAPSLDLTNVTISGNTVMSTSGDAMGGGIYNDTSIINLKNTILSGNTSSGNTTSEGAECGGDTCNSYGYNFIATATTSNNCSLIYTTSGADSSTDITTKTSSELLLDALADNGGETQSHALQASSPAIDAGTCTDIDGNTVSTDQRGETRTSICDIGAYEVVCGDGDEAGNEECDDSNTTDGDGCSATCTDETDADGDGYYAESDDCNDSNASINPGVSGDDCSDGIDNNCNGATDDGTFWYLDVDADGYGDSESAGTSQVSCSNPSEDYSLNYVSTTGDCDDGNASVNPGVSEVCGDSTDNDCNGSIDDETVWYADADGDTYGDSATTQSSCTRPSGYVTTATDCDDGDASVNPAGSETCGNSADEDCSGSDLSCTCGDGTTDTGESCDDSNTTDGDGCSSTCTTETEQICNNGTDDDGNGLTDCDDSGCTTSPDCVDAGSDIVSDPVVSDPAEIAALDSDGDGVSDPDDVFPQDASESSDADQDGVGDNADADDATPAATALDSDGDGVADAEDAFPNDVSESVDTDQDGVGDNADADDATPAVTALDSDGDGVTDAEDAFPNDASESVDTDGDGTGDNADNDGDGTGDNTDTDDNNDDTGNTGDSQDNDADGDGIDDSDESESASAAATTSTGCGCSFTAQNPNGTYHNSLMGFLVLLTVLVLRYLRRNKSYPQDLTFLDTPLK